RARSAAELGDQTSCWRPEFESTTTVMPSGVGGGVVSRLLDVTPVGLVLLPQPLSSAAAASDTRTKRLNFTTCLLGVTSGFERMVHNGGGPLASTGTEGTSNRGATGVSTSGRRWRGVLGGADARGRASGRGGE